MTPTPVASATTTTNQAWVQSKQGWSKNSGPALFLCFGTSLEGFQKGRQVRFLPSAQRDTEAFPVEL